MVKEGNFGRSVPSGPSIFLPTAIKALRTIAWALNILDIISGFFYGKLWEAFKFIRIRTRKI